jgi:hypothetical protein
MNNNDRRPQQPARKTTTRVVRPATQRVTPAAGVRPGTARYNPPGSRPAAPAPNNNKTIIIGASVAGGLVLILGLAMALGGGREEKRPVTKPKVSSTPSATPRKVDVSGLIREGQQKCEEGYQIIVSCQPMIEEYHRTNSGGSELKAKLQKGLALISSGNECFSKAQEQSGGEQGFSDKKYVEASYAARKIVSELN